MSRAVGIGLLVVVATAAVYAQVGGFEFVDFDDNVYVSENEQVLGGLRGEGLAWAFTTTLQANWHPLTWMSHMLDASLFGADPGGHHLGNLALHVLNVALLLALLFKATGRLWPSVVVASLFALHPINVESVAWVSERKNLLSMAFGLGSALAYVRYSRTGGARSYVLTALLLALGLMAKPMLVTLPLVFLLLDYWPLGRVAELRVGKLLVEKLPFLALAIASSVVTLIVQAAGGAVVGTTAELPVMSRVANALVAYAVYLRKAVWPFDLAVHYQHPDAPGGVPLTAGQLLGAAAVLLVITVVVARFSTRRYLTVGWLWFLGTLVPMIGLVQVGEQGMADRYAYLPLIGIFIAVVWACGDLLGTARIGSNQAGAVLACVVLAALSAATWGQARYWRDSVALFERGLAVSPDSPTLHYNLGTTLEEQSRFVEAIEHYERALEIGPETANVHWGLANCLRAQRRSDDAIAHYRKSIAIDPAIADVHFNLGDAVRERGDVAGALEHYERALAIDPDLVGARNNLGTGLLAMGQVEAAIRTLSEVVKRDPSMAEAHNNLGAAWMQRRGADQALEHFREAARLRPDWHIPAASAARVLVTHPDPSRRNPSEAVVLANRASELTGHRDPMILDVLAMALALNGQHADAARVAEVALEIVSDMGQNQLRDDIRGRLERYKRGEPPY